jgi:hypothetical protein
MGKFLMHIIGPLLITFSMCNCGGAFDKILCGEPQGRKKIFIDSVNQKWAGKLILKQVPCYPGYIQINLTQDVDNAELSIIESSFGETVEWAELLVYNKNGKLIRGDKGSM